MARFSFLQMLLEGPQASSSAWLLDHAPPGRDVPVSPAGTAAAASAPFEASGSGAQASGTPAPAPAEPFALLSAPPASAPMAPAPETPAAAPAAMAPAAEPAASSDPGERLYIVFLSQAPGGGKAALQTRAAALLGSLGVAQEAAFVYEQLGGFAVRLADRDAQRLRALGGVQSVEADAAVAMVQPIVSTSTGALGAYVNTTGSSGEILPWGVQAVWRGQDVSARGNLGEGAIAFVIDSGVSDGTGDLALAADAGWHASWIAGESPFADGNGHGSHVAGTIAAQANGRGVVGVAPGATVVSLKVFDSSGGGASYATVIDAVNHAVAVINGAGLDRSRVVINMSLGGGANSSMETAVRNAADQGVRFAIAAGNSGSDADGVSPANAGDHANVFTVSAVDSSYQMASWSNWDVPSRRDVDDVDLAAPGVGVLSYYRDGQLATLSGTSMAAPHVAGLLLLGGVSAGPLATPVVSGSADPFALVLDSLVSEPVAGGSGEAGPQILWGTTASDTITGGAGDDQIAGVTATGSTAASLGKGQIDTLVGGAGADTFLLADGRGVFYVGGNSRNMGTGDYALIADFNAAEGDRLQLRQGLSFLARTVDLGGITTTEIYLSDGNAVLGNGDDLIARLQGVALASGSAPVALGADQSWISFV
ncbi:MAG: S8 family serine peptidase [Prochlorococcaceae cyanobacterium]